VDHKRNVIFYRQRDNCQTVHSEVCIYLHFHVYIYPSCNSLYLIYCQLVSFLHILACCQHVGTGTQIKSEKLSTYFSVKI
jgi:hypothetical protein